jgi:hypothetical protein
MLFKKALLCHGNLHFVHPLWHPLSPCHKLVGHRACSSLPSLFRQKKKPPLPSEWRQDRGSNVPAKDPRSTVDVVLLRNVVVCNSWLQQKPQRGQDFPPESLGSLKEEFSAAQ